MQFVQHVENENDEESNASSVSETILKIEGSNKKLYTHITFDIHGSRRKIKCQLDRGATCNVIGFKGLYVLSLKTIKQILNWRKSKLKCFGGHIIHPTGQAFLKCRMTKRIYKLVFEVVAHSHRTLLSSSICQTFGLIKLQQHYGTTKRDKGKIEGKFSLEVDSKIKPVN